METTKEIPNDLPVSPIHIFNIILFGESGVGKSAVVNQIFDKEAVRVGNQAVGCTIESAKVSGFLKDYPNIYCNVYDTIGLSESSRGSVPTAQAFVELIKLAYAVPDGINLLICCHPKGRISSERFKANYRIFKEELCENRIPCILVVTRCEGDDPIDEWWFENKDLIRQQLEFDFADGVCVSTIRTKKNDPKTVLEEYKTSRRNLIETILRKALREPILIDSWSRKVFVTAREFYNKVTDWVSWVGLQKLTLRPELKAMFLSLNFTEEQAEDEVQKLFNILTGDLSDVAYQQIDA